MKKVTECKNTYSVELFRATSDKGSFWVSPVADANSCGFTYNYLSLDQKDLPKLIAFLQAVEEDLLS